MSEFRIAASMPKTGYALRLMRINRLATREEKEER